MSVERQRLILTTDARHGGRWTSLRAGRREWLWTNPDRPIVVARTEVGPGAAFVDAGGAEECYPTVRGEPDHGDAWTRPWRVERAASSVEVPGVGVLTRRIETVDDALQLDYTVDGPPGTAFLHAVHALLDVGPEARLEVPGATEAIVRDSTRPTRPWPNGLDRLGPDDGTAICVLLPGCREATVLDGDDELQLAWDAPARPEVCSLLLWRNLSGWPAERPYRSIGVEPMVGRTAELARAAPDEAVRMDASGRFAWTLRLTARRRTDPSQTTVNREEALR